MPIDTLLVNALKSHFFVCTPFFLLFYISFPSGSDVIAKLIIQRRPLQPQHKPQGGISPERGMPILYYYANWQQTQHTHSQYNNTENLQKHKIKNRIKHTTIYESTSGTNNVQAF